MNTRFFSVATQCATLWIALALMPTPAASFERVSQRTEIEYWAAADGDEGRLALSRLSIRPSLRLRAPNDWDIELKGRLEGAYDRTGLGTTRSYSPASRPLIDSDHARLAIDEFVLSRRFGASRLSIGKQTIAWGVLDGIQITDRFDPVRRRDFVLTEIRPERLARWGVRWRHDGEGLRADLAVAFDPTVNQLAQAGDRFEPRAPRLRGGLSSQLDSSAFDIVQSDRDRYWQDATFGLRLSHPIGRADASVLFLSGPDPEPLLRLAAIDPQRPTIELVYPRRELVGATLEVPDGSRIWRLELAHIPDQAINIEAPVPLSSDRTARTLAGIGLDWNAPRGWFVNAQLALDRLSSDAPTAVRPQTDVISTLRAQRGFVQDTLRFRTELLTSLSDGDGVFRTSLDWQFSDPLRLSIGADRLFGDRDGLFGQYRDASQVWVRVTLVI
ncbi:MAG: hypothetical protein V2J42_10980 [Wenzhouxiangella sp.]|jgi:hypothetical protein|nr:hypothetical protein [Wenzhouxiangella sp.]